MAVMQIVQFDPSAQIWLGFAKAKARELMDLYGGVSARATEDFRRAGVDIDRPFNEVFHRVYHPAAGVTVAIRGLFVNGQWLVKLRLLGQSAPVVPTIIKLFKNTIPTGDGFLSLDSADFAIPVKRRRVVGLRSLIPPQEGQTKYTAVLASGPSDAARGSPYTLADARRLFDEGHWPALAGLVPSSERRWVRVPVEHLAKFPAYMPVRLVPVHYFLNEAGDVMCVATAVVEPSTTSNYVDIPPVAPSAIDAVNATLGPAPSGGYNGMGLKGADLAAALRQVMPAAERGSRFAMVFRLKDMDATATVGEPGPARTWQATDAAYPWRLDVELFGETVTLPIAKSDLAVADMTVTYSETFDPHTDTNFLVSYVVAGKFVLREGGNPLNVTEYRFTGTIALLKVVPRTQIFTSARTTGDVADSYYSVSGRWADWGPLRDLRAEVFGADVPEFVGLQLARGSSRSMRYWNNEITSTGLIGSYYSQLGWLTSAEARPFTPCVAAYIAATSEAQDNDDYSGSASITKNASVGRVFSFEPDGSVATVSVPEFAVGDKEFSSTALDVYTFAAGPQFDVFQNRTLTPFVAYQGGSSESAAMFGAFTYADETKALIGEGSIDATTVTEGPFPFVIAPDVSFALYASRLPGNVYEYTIRVGDRVATPSVPDVLSSYTGWTAALAGNYDVWLEASGSITNEPHSGPDGTFNYHGYPLAPSSRIGSLVFNADQDITRPSFSWRDEVRFSEYPQSFGVRLGLGSPPKYIQWIASTTYLRIAGSAKVCAILKHPLAKRLAKLLHCADFAADTAEHIQGRLKAIRSALENYYPIANVTPSLEQAIDYYTNTVGKPEFSIDTYKTHVRTGLRTFYSVIGNTFASDELLDYLAGFDQTVVLFPYH